MLSAFKAGKAVLVAGANFFRPDQRRAVRARHSCVCGKKSSEMLRFKVVLVECSKVAVYHARDVGFLDEFGYCSLITLIHTFHYRFGINAPVTGLLFLDAFSGRSRSTSRSIPAHDCSQHRRAPVRSGMQRASARRMPTNATSSSTAMPCVTSVAAAFEEGSAGL
jgi:hypothetical protein